MKAGMRDTNWYYRTESNRRLPVSNRRSAFELQQHVCYALIGHCFIALLYILFLSASLKCVAYVYISIYRRVATFSGTPGGCAHIKTASAGESTSAPAPGVIDPAARRRSLLEHGQNGAVRHPHTDQPIRTRKPAFFRGANVA